VSIPSTTGIDGKELCTNQIPLNMFGLILTF
jgi:hypothetical protein